jgi:uncharacterized membrane protein YbhN (UPF0104 family)
MRRAVKIVFGVSSVALGVCLLIFLLPHALGVGWGTTVQQIAALSGFNLLCLAVVWLAGLGVHTITLRRSLPGLSARRALALNLGGSSVANLLPLGGAAGIGINYAMLRSWGYDRLEITAFTAVSNLIVTLAKVLIAAGGTVALFFMPSFVDQLPDANSAGAIALYVAAGVLLLGAAACCYTPVRRWLVRRTSTVIVQLWRQCADVLRSGWRGLAVGGLGYPLMQALLLWLCVGALHANVGLVAVLAAYAIERTLTLIPITPGGVGVVETVAAAVLVGFGADPVKAAAAVLLYRVFSYLLEIPVGALVVAAWFTRRRAARRAV